MARQKNAHENFDWHKNGQIFQVWPDLTYFLDI